MRGVARQPIRLIVISCVSAMTGNALYGWRKHGAVDWIRVAEFGLGWAIGSAGFSAVARMRARRQNANGIEGSV
jgi:uncharacterized membrane protein YfcA